MSPAALPYVSPPSPAPTAGVCRVCGCTDWEGCLLEVGDGFVVTCHWAEVDLCSRCWGPRRPTRFQLGELGRIRSRQGPLEVRRGRRTCELELTLAATRAVGDYFVTRPTVITLDRRGRITNRLDREVIRREPVRAGRNTEEGYL